MRRGLELVRARRILTTLRRALSPLCPKLDFENDKALEAEAMATMIADARRRDTLTLWHLIYRVEGLQREARI